MPRAVTAAAHVAAWTALALAAQPVAAQPDAPDTCAAASIVEVGGPERAEAIDPLSDADWYAAALEAGHLYQISVYPSSEGWWPAVEVFAPGCGVPVRGSEDYWRLFVAHSTGVHPIRVAAATWSRFGGMYTIEVKDLGPHADEAGDTPAVSTPLALGGAPAEGRLDFDYDADVYRFALEEQATYRIRLAALTCHEYAFSDIMGYFRRPDGSYHDGILWAVSSGCEHLGLAEMDAYIPAGEGGEHTLTLFGTTLAEYEVSVALVQTWPVPDDHADTCAGATPLAGPEPAAAGAIGAIGDEDWFALECLAGHRYLVGFPPASLGYARVEIAGPDCSPLPTTPHPVQSFVAQMAGTHYLRITAENPTAYTVPIADAGPVTDDHAAGHASATPIVPGGPAATGERDYDEDVDSFVFYGEERASYLIELTSDRCAHIFGVLETPQPWDPWLYAQGPLPGCPERDSRVTLFIPPGSAGPVYLHVRPYEDAVYTVSVTMVGLAPATDQPDTCDGAAAIDVGGTPVEASADTAEDTDWFRFDAVAGHAYEIAVQTQAAWSMLNVADHSCDPYEPVATNTFPGVLRAAADGPLHFAVRLASGPETYRVAVLDHGPVADDHEWHAATAWRLRTDGTREPGRIEFDRDTDAARVWLRPGLAYRVTLRSPGCDRLFGSLLAPGHPEFEVAHAYLLGGSGCNGPQTDEFIYYVTSDNAGDHSFVVRGLPGVAPSDFTISVEPLGCTADTDASGTITSADISAFLATWIAAVGTPAPGDLAGDFSGDAVTDSSDIAAFLAAWLAAAAGGCP